MPVDKKFFDAIDGKISGIIFKNIYELQEKIENYYNTHKKIYETITLLKDKGLESKDSTIIDKKIRIIKTKVDFAYKEKNISRGMKPAEKEKKDDFKPKKDYSFDLNIIAETKLENDILHAQDTGGRGVNEQILNYFGLTLNDQPYWFFNTRGTKVVIQNDLRKILKAEKGNT